MFIQLVTFHLKGMTAKEYEAMAVQVAPTLVGTPGLVSKAYLADPETNTFGGLYTWRDRQSMEDYLRSDVMAAVRNHPNLTDVAIRVFGVLEEPTRINNGLITAAV